MAKKPDFDTQAAHKYFSGHCFNAAWDFIEKKDRSADDDDRMIRLAQTSVWHWTQRQDCVDKNLSVGYWQLSRVYSLVGRADEARKYGQISLKYGENEEPFYKAYAYEALARAESIAGNKKKADEYISKARELTEQVSDPESKKLLIDDLNSIAVP